MLTNIGTIISQYIHGSGHPLVNLVSALSVKLGRRTTVQDSLSFPFWFNPLSTKPSRPVHPGIKARMGWLRL